MTTVFLPLVFGPEAPDDNTLLANSAVSVAALATLFTGAPHQQRRNLEAHVLLGRVATERAVDMAVNNYFSHVDRQDHGPNWHVRRVGYKLPENYGQHDAANNIESICLGGSDANEIWDTWLSSPQHRAHVLGEGFYRNQSCYGIGYAVADDRHYWVLITAPPMEEVT